MKTLSCLLFIISISHISLSQQPVQNRLHLRTGTVAPVLLSQTQLQDFTRRSVPVANRRFAILQFETMPTAADRTNLAKQGITLLDYIPNASYTASLSKPVTASLLRTLHVRSIQPVSTTLKLSESLTGYLTNNQSTDVVIAYFKEIPFDTVTHQLAKQGVMIKDFSAKEYELLTVHVPAGKMKALLDLPFVFYVDVVPPPAEPLNFESRKGTGANILQSDVPGGYHLTGEGVTLAICEGGGPIAHTDFKDRLVQGPIDVGFHNTHVTGIAAGAGNVAERYRGYAPRARIVTNSGSFFYHNLKPLVNDLGLVLANHSFGGGFSCFTAYNIFNMQYDRQPNDFPTLLNVYACGNSGVSPCGNGYPPGFGTVVPIANSAKNALTVGATDHVGNLYHESSKGPGSGGRIKPEIMAPGYSVWSTSNNGGYASTTGTSMSSPAAVGGLALLNQRYRQLHNGIVPDGGLMKAVITNTATDLGNPGPDYSFGFGMMNLLRAVRSLDHEWYFTDSLQHQAQKQHVINVPAGTTRLKVMLYWHDAPYNPFSSRVLTNDLDLKVTTPSGATVLPLVLDTIHSNVQLPATEKEDHLNNIEQVVIDNPVAGNYTISVRGTEIGQSNAQKCYIVYDIIGDSVEMIYPHKGEGSIPGETLNIRWQDAHSNTATYTLEFSADGGATWQLINAAVAASARNYAWRQPTNVTTSALIRITRNDGSSEHVSGQFSIIGLPQLILSPAQCPGYIQVQWPAVTGATDYELFMVRNGQMEPVATTTGTSYTFTGCSPDTTYWVSVRTRVNGIPGTRAVAVSRKPDNGSCAGNISNGDVQLVSMTAPKSGRRYTSGEPGHDEQITIQIRNLDDQTSGAITVYVNFNNTGWVSEPITTPLPAGGVIEHRFSTPFDLSAFGSYDIKVAVKGDADNNPSNDSIHTSISHIDNPVIDLATPFIDSFATAVEKSYITSTQGLEGASRYDYDDETRNGTLSYGAVRLLNESPARPGMKLSLQDIMFGGSGHHQLIGTYNLSLYDTAMHNVLLRFNNSTLNTIHNRVYIRGNDTLPWVLAYEQPEALLSVADLYSPVINLGSLLRQAKQNFSSSFQVSFDQRAVNLPWSIAEIDLTLASQDLAVNSIDSMAAVNCNMGNAVPVYITVSNYGRQPATGVHVKYQVDGGAITDEVIQSILPDSSLAYRFNRLAGLGAPGAHTIEAWVENTGDTYLSNNRVKWVVHNQPMISLFPYLEDFENGDGHWFAAGTNNSWEIGTPASTVIRGAASGEKAWKTNLDGDYNFNEFTYLTGPCFNLSGMQRPAISMSLFTNLDYCNTSCDVLHLQYSTNNGASWFTAFNPPQYYNSQHSDWAYKYGKGWKVTTLGLPDSPQVRIRLLFRTNNFLNLDGIAIDDIHIYDSVYNIYNGATTATPVEQTIQGGNDWVNIVKDGSLVAAINPYNQNLGITKTKVFMNQGDNRHFHGQYYLNRNLHISSENKPADSVGVRIYFRDSEVDSLLSAINCASCTKPSHAYRLGVSTYALAADDGVVPDSLYHWTFIPYSRVHIVPFQDGYYAEFKVKDLSAFWLSDGGLDNNSYLPVRLVSFAVSKSGTNALVEWSTAAEINMHHYEIEVAKGNEAFKQGNFAKAGEIAAGGPYSFTDGADNKTGVYYYRIKAVDTFGNFAYSHALPLIWSDELPWQVFPNPAPGGRFKLQYQAENNAPVQINIYNSAGALVKQQQVKGNGFVQQAVIDLGRSYPAGLYLLQARVGDRTIHLKLIK